jgi:hypothetical protein
MSKLIKKEKLPVKQVLQKVNLAAVKVQVEVLQKASSNFL